MTSPETAEYIDRQKLSEDEVAQLTRRPKGEDEDNE